ncbi:hypothetical protein CJ030_MR1G023801 [Morella rubra]|uniref:Uncharacterized protein n=1 Tax=Morella rubra TaxID=262757 RepID=A0A6A1WS53_9ROSI|nr:hypothetical protein CJ030_MR1G023801 [Morella rubra]
MQWKQRRATGTWIVGRRDFPTRTSQQPLLNPPRTLELKVQNSESSNQTAKEDENLKITPTLTLRGSNLSLEKNPSFFSLEALLPQTVRPPRAGARSPTPQLHSAVPSSPVGFPSSSVSTLFLVSSVEGFHSRFVLFWSSLLAARFGNGFTSLFITVPPFTGSELIGMAKGTITLDTISPI